MNIIIDSREQSPLFVLVSKSQLKKGSYSITNLKYPEYKFIVRKLDEGDYCIPELIDKLVVERKSPNDLLNSLVKGHNRFMDELLRARLKGKRVYIFVECSKQDFLSHHFDGGWYSRINGRVLAKMIATIEDKYQPIFVWCEGRADMERKILATFEVWVKL